MKFLIGTSVCVLAIAATVAAQQPGAKPPDHMQHRFDAEHDFLPRQIFLTFK